MTKLRWDLIHQFVALGRELTDRENDAANRLSMRPTLRRIARATKKCAAGDCSELFSFMRVGVDQRIEALEKVGGKLKVGTETTMCFTCSHGRLHEVIVEPLAAKP